MKKAQIETLVSLAKRRGFVFPSSEIYGGFSSSYDYGPYGAELLKNIKQAWWKAMVQDRDDIVGLNSAILMNPKIWEASGHLTAGFADPLVECKKCHKRYRADHLEEEGQKTCPGCGHDELTEPRDFNLMMKTFIGTVEDKKAEAYLRPETAQGIYVNFHNVRETSRKKIPFGIAQIGKAFRNEVTPGNFIFRMREFEQMEMQFFVPPKDAEKWFQTWTEIRKKWYDSIGINPKKLSLHQHGEQELAHYAKVAQDIYYEFPFGKKELEGIHNRGDWDLSNHGKYSGRDLQYFDDIVGEKYYPYIVETSVGADRLMFVALSDAYTEEEVKSAKGKRETRVILKFHPSIAPIKVAVFPLVKKEKNIVSIAKDIFHDLKSRYMVEYDETGSIGKLYRRQDEIGTPFCITVDYESLEKNTVTVRDRDTMKQERVKIDQLQDFFQKKL